VGLTNIAFRLTVELGASVIWQSELTIAKNGDLQIQDLGVMCLPPVLAGVVNVGDLNLVLLARLKAAGSTINQGLDFLCLMPASGWRSYACTSGVVGYRYIIDDPYNRCLARGDSSKENLVAVVNSYGSALMVRPGVDQRLYFLFHGTAAGDCDIDHYLSVWLKYHPRRKSL
jgi:hypothetical protein